MELFDNLEKKEITQKKEKISLRDKFIEPPFTLLDSKTASWRSRMKYFKLNKYGSRYIECKFDPDLRQRKLYFTNGEFKGIELY